MRIRRAIGPKVLLCLAGIAAGCDGSKSPEVPPAKASVPLAIRRPDASMRVFSGSDETPTATYAFEGARGSVRVSMEIDGLPGPNPAQPLPPSLNDVLFRAQGDGRISVVFKRPSPDHPRGRVTIRCTSGDEESSAEFEPELWYHVPGAIVTFETAPDDPTDPVLPGREVILGRYVARNIPRDIRLTLKAVFTADPVAPRTKAGLKAPR